MRGTCDEALLGGNLADMAGVRERGDGEIDLSIFAFEKGGCLLAAPPLLLLLLLLL